MTISDIISQRAIEAMAAVGIPEHCLPNVVNSSKPQFGDFQINGAMAAAKIMKTNPRQLAQNIVEHLSLHDMADKVEIAGPGFINVHLRNDWLSEYTSGLAVSENVGVAKTANPQTVVIDYSSPNLAKEMHVGHLRSTIIGDAVARVLTFLGHHVIRQNHIGDWGTQFGMLIAELEEQLASDADMELGDLETFYRQAKVHFDESPEFADKAREYVVLLQAGDARCQALWKRFIDLSLAHSEAMYKKLGVLLTPDDVHGESAYNDDLPHVVSELQEQGLAVTDQGAQVVFLDELADKKGNPSPVIIQKAGGGYLYATTDLAALRYRANHLNADRILVFVDARQSLHMQQVFCIAKKAGWVSEHVELTHGAFGTMMGEDGKPFKTRSGDTVKLVDLVDEAIERAAKVVAEKNPQLTAEACASIAHKVGIGAVKYADLSKTRTNDYIFSWDAMLSLEGNTAPYLQYAYTRIQSIFAKKGQLLSEQRSNIILQEAAERELALKISQFSDVVEQVAIKAYPHELCQYLFSLAGNFMTFYEACPILKAGIDEQTQESRLALSGLTAKVLEQGLALLGIDVMDRM